MKMLVENSNNNTTNWRTIQKKKNIPNTNVKLLNNKRVTTKIDLILYQQRKINILKELKIKNYIITQHGKSKKRPTIAIIENYIHSRNVRTIPGRSICASTEENMNCLRQSY